MFFLANHNSPEQTPHTRLNSNVVVVGALRTTTTNCRVSFIDLYFATVTEIVLKIKLRDKTAIIIYKKIRI